VATLKTDVATLKTDVAMLKTDVATLKTYNKHSSYADEMRQTLLMKQYYEENDSHLHVRVSVCPLRMVYRSNNSELTDLDGLLNVCYAPEAPNNSTARVRRHVANSERFGQNTTRYVSLPTALSHINSSVENVDVNCKKLIVIEVKHFFDRSHVDDKMAQVLEFKRFADALRTNNYPPGNFRNMADVYDIDKLPVNNIVLYFVGYCAPIIKEYIRMVFDGVVTSAYHAWNTRYMLGHVDVLRSIRILRSHLQQNRVVRNRRELQRAFRSNMETYAELDEFIRQLSQYASEHAASFSRDDTKLLTDVMNMYVPWSPQLRKTCAKFQGRIGYIDGSDRFGELETQK
jgi:hypothetical protein